MSEKLDLSFEFIRCDDGWLEVVILLGGQELARKNLTDLLPVLLGEEELHPGQVGRGGTLRLTAEAVRHLGIEKGKDVHIYLVPQVSRVTGRNQILIMTDEDLEAYLSGGGGVVGEGME